MKKSVFLLICIASGVFVSGVAYKTVPPEMSSPGGYIAIWGNVAMVIVIGLFRPKKAVAVVEA